MFSPVRYILFNRMTAGAALVIAAIRAYQLLTLTDGSFASAAGNPAASFFSVTNISLAVFVFVPLYAFYLLPALRLVKNTSYLIRNKSKEGCVYSFALLAAAQAVLFALLVSASGALVVLLKAPGGMSVGGVAAVAGASAILEACFFAVCALLLYAAYWCTGGIQGAVIVLLCYAMWDFLTDHIPLYAGTLPVVGWHLTEVSFPLEPFGLLRGLLPLLSLSAFLICVSLVAIRRCDLLGINNAENDA